MTTRKHAIIADDDDDLRRLVSLALELDGFETVEARDAAELLAALTRFPACDIVLSDLRMPGATELTRAKGLENLRNAPLVLMTAAANDEARAFAARLGAAAILRKPFDIGTLRATVRRVSRRAA